MSQETAQWLNTMTLIGNTDQRGNAWHYRAAEQGDESNHYPGPVPVGDVKRRLFEWEAVSRRVAVEFDSTVEMMTHLSDTGAPMRWGVQKDRQAICPSDKDIVMGMFKDGYKSHQYRLWLINNVETILGTDLAISSAGLLRNRAVAWVEVSVPDTIQTPEGVAFRPNLLACTSFDGSLSTTYKRTVQLTVCDNTMNAALGEAGQTIKVKHSSKSLGRIEGVRDALAMVHETAESFAADVARLCAQKITPVQFKEVLSALVPIGDDDSKRGKTIAEDKRGVLTRLYRYDPRVAPWTGTAFGVIQAFNTWSHHEQNGLPAGSQEDKLRARADRNAMRAITGETDKSDTAVLRVLAGVAG